VTIAKKREKRRRDEETKMTEKETTRRGLICQTRETSAPHCDANLEWIQLALIL
jgi:hypothetical protein